MPALQRARLSLVTFVACAAGLSTTALGAAAPEPGSAIIEYTLEVAVPGKNGWGYGEIHLYAIDDGGDMAARKSEGRAAMLERLPGAVELAPGTVSAAFTLFGVRWAQPGTSWRYNPAGATTAMPAANALAAIQFGADGWRHAGGSAFEFGYLGETSTKTGCNGDLDAYAKDGENVVGWGHIAGWHLGFSCHWRGVSLVEGTPYFAIEEFDIVLEPVFAYDQQKLRALALHEFGHALGLDHAEESSCPGRAMCAGEDAMLFTAPQEDDLNGVIALYGKAQPNPAPPPSSRPFKVVSAALARD